MSETNANTELRDAILSLAEERRTAEIEDTFLELLAMPPADDEFYRLFIRRMNRAQAPDTALSLLLMLLEEILKRQDWDLLHRAVRIMADTWPETKELRPFAAKALKGVHAGHPHLDQMLASCKGLPLNEVFRKFDALLLYSPGEVYTHAYWGEGIVRSLDLPGGKIVLDFPAEKGKTLELGFFRKHLQHLPPGSFLARRAKDPAALRAFAEEDPVGFVKLALAGAGGRLKQSDLKNLIIGGVIDEDAWTSWWNRARNSLRVDPMVDFNAKGGAHSDLALRDTPRSVEDEVEEVFFAPDAGKAAWIASLEILEKASKAAPVSTELVGRMLRHLASWLSGAGAGEGLRRAEVVFICEDLCVLAPEHDLAQMGVAPAADIAAAAGDDYAPLLAFENADYAVRALKLLLARDGESGVQRAAAILTSSQPRLAAAVWNAFDTEHHLQLQVQALRALLERPLDNPETYGWALKNLCEGKWPHLDDHVPLSGIVPDLIDSVAEWHFLAQKGTSSPETVATAKSLLSRARSLLTARNCAVICSAAEQVPIEQVQRMRQAIATNDAFNETFKSTADHQLLLTRRELIGGSAAPSAAPAPAGGPGGDPDLHWCTAKARELKLAELRELNTVTIPANAMEIERARQEGDLKENAGYTYAKEKQKLLIQTSLRLQQDVASARVFDKGRVKTDAIGFGVTFEAENLDKNRRESFTILGRFETAPEKNILSYQSPFMQQFVGRKPGDELTVSHPGGGETRYRVVSLSNALAGGEWDLAPGEA